MQFCVKCQAEISNGFKFCSLCGAPQIQPQTQTPENETQCPKCNRMIKSNAKFCEYCGAVLMTSQYSNTTYTNPPPIDNPYLYNNYSNVPPSYYPVQKKHTRAKAIAVVIVLIAAVFGVYKLDLLPGFSKIVDAGLASINSAAGNGTKISSEDLSADILPEYEENISEAVVSIDTGVLESDIEDIENAFREGNAEKAADFVHPESRERYKKLFTENISKLDRISKLLETRKPLYQGDEYAEYEVTDNGKTYTVIFQKVNDKWMLSAL